MTKKSIKEGTYEVDLGARGRGLKGAPNDSLLEYKIEWESQIQTFGHDTERVDYFWLIWFLNNGPYTFRKK